MRMRAVALLRGVNVGGVRFAMADLRAALEQAGFRDVRTVLASGNVLLTSDADDAAEVAAAVRRVVLDRFGLDVAVLVVDLPTVRTAVDGYPYEAAADRHAYVVFGGDSAVLEELLALAAEVDSSVERVQGGDGVVYWEVPKGRTLDSPFGKRFGQRAKAGVVTTRNRNTLERILAAG
jgi:uncharacterized protein (DUF1697 family)